MPRLLVPLFLLALVAAVVFLAGCASEAAETSTTEPLTPEAAIAEVGTRALLHTMLMKDEFSVFVLPARSGGAVLCDRVGGKLSNCCPINYIVYDLHGVNLDDKRLGVRVAPRCL